MERNAADRAVAALAARRHGVVSTYELSSAGLSHHAVAHRAAHGWLQRCHRGVYLVGSTPGPFTREAAAVLACGDSAVLSYRSAAVLWTLGPVPPADVDVTVTAKVRPRAGIRLHRVLELDPRREIAHRDGLAITTPARTLLDLATVLPRRELELAVNEALVLKLATAMALHSYLARSSTRHGAAKLDAVLRANPGITRSEAERRALRLIRSAQLPAPQTEVRVAGHLADLFWPDLRLVVEIDGAAFHDTPRAFQADRSRDADLIDAGFRVLRITRWEVVHEAAATVARLARATAARPPPTAARPPPTAARPP